jgi:DNA-binding IclR family transcriptional regulator
LQKDQEKLSSVSNALRVLNCFSVINPERRVTDVARELGIGKSTASRLLQTLAGEGYVRKDPVTQKYSLGLRILTLASMLTSNLEIVREAKPILQKLVLETGESAQIAQLEGNKLIYVNQVRCKQPINIAAYTGRINPIHCTSSGRLLLAYQSEKHQQEILGEKLEKFTVHTVTDHEKIENSLEIIKNQGFCIMKNEFIKGIISVSAPVWDYREKVIAAISVVGPASRLDDQRINYCKSRVISSASKLSEKLGYFNNNQ